MKNKLKILRYFIAAAAIVFLLIQLIPYGHIYTNPPIVSEPKWDSPQTREVAKRACFNCHSNETYYPWYAYVAPSSWLLRWDIDRGRDAYNYSDWDNYPTSADIIARDLLADKMPPWQFLLMHPEARLSAAEKQQFIDGLRKSFATVPK
jgi:peptidoglycan/xylan/chitin deacetylase (PgdA/CDA1 family)